MAMRRKRFLMSTRYSRKNLPRHISNGTPSRKKLLNRSLQTGGQMRKPDLLLLHGALGSSDQLAELSELLTQHYNVHTFDFEGHGKTSSRERPFRIEHFAENILEYLD